VKPAENYSSLILTDVENPKTLDELIGIEEVYQRVCNVSKCQCTQCRLTFLALSLFQFILFDNSFFLWALKWSWLKGNYEQNGKER